MMLEFLVFEVLQNCFFVLVSCVRDWVLDLHFKATRQRKRHKYLVNIWPLFLLHVVK